MYGGSLIFYELVDDDSICNAMQTLQTMYEAEFCLNNISSSSSSTSSNSSNNNNNNNNNNSSFNNYSNNYEYFKLNIQISLLHYHLLINNHRQHQHQHHLHQMLQIIIY